MIPYKLPNIDGTQITATTTAASLEALISTAASESFEIPSNLDAINLSVASGTIRILADGNEPTTTKGFPLSAGTYKLRGLNLRKIYIIATSGTVTVDIQIGLSGAYNVEDSVNVVGGGGSSTPPSQANYVFADHFIQSLTNNAPWSLSGVTLSADTPPTGTIGLARFVVPASVGNINFLRASATPNVRVASTPLNVATTWVFGAGLTGSNLSSALQEYKMFSGLTSDVTFGASLLQIGFLYDRATDGDFVTCITRNGAIGDQTKTVTTVALTADSIRNLSFAVSADGTTVTFYNGSTVIATHTDDIPTGLMYLASYVERLVGSGSRSVYVDYKHLLNY
jgi:hypothetical protein